MTSPRLTSASIAGTDRDAVRVAIGRAAERTGVDFTYLLNQAQSESGLNPAARATTSSASGLYQFIDQSWLGVLKQHGAKHGLGWAANAIQRTSGGQWTVADPQMRQAVFALRNQAEPAALMAAEFASDNAEGLGRALGRQPSSTDLYFAHFLGLHGATKFLKAANASPGATAASLFPREAQANRGIFYNRSGEARSLGQVYALMARKIGGDGGAVQMARRNDPAATGLSSAQQLAYNDAVRILGPDEMPASTAAPGTGPGSGSDTNEMLAMLGRNGGVNVLRPSPQHARLAYLLLGTGLDDSVSG